MPTLFFLELARIPPHVSTKFRIIAFLCIIRHILGISSHYFLGMFFPFDPNIYFWSFGNSWKRIPPQIYQLGKASIEFFAAAIFLYGPIKTNSILDSVFSSGTGIFCMQFNVLSRNFRILFLPKGQYQLMYCTICCFFPSSFY